MISRNKPGSRMEQGQTIRISLRTWSAIRYQIMSVKMPKNNQQENNERQQAE